MLPKPPAAPVPAGLPFPVVGISLFCILRSSIYRFEFGHIPVLPLLSAVARPDPLLGHRSSCLGQWDDLVQQERPLAQHKCLTRAVLQVRSNAAR